MGSFPISVRSKFWPKHRVDWGISIVALILMPIIYIYEMFVVHPSVWGFWPLFHQFIPYGGFFVFLNIVTNYVGLVVVSTRVPSEVMSTRRPSMEWHYCDQCVSYVPPRSWHCKYCKVCILKRDHHCLFGGCCVGYFNCRFFIMYLMYLFVGTLYCVITDTMFLWNKIDFTSPSVLLKIGFPAFAYFFGLETLSNACCIILFIINWFVFIFVSYMLRFHVHINLKGQVTHEATIGSFKYDLGKLNNLREVLGNRWHVAWIFPLISSPLPRNGLEWETVEKRNSRHLKTSQKSR